jgi:hypothetical protein
MPVSFKYCDCGVRLTLPSAWDSFRCHGCGWLFQRVGGIFFPVRQAKVG